MKRLRSAVLVLIAGLIGLALAASALGKPQTAAKIRHVQGRIEALAIDGNRIVYDVGSTLGKADNKVLVWNVRSGQTTTVSGKRTRTVDDSSTGAGVFELAIVGSRVAWMANVGGNSEGDDYLFTSSVTKPKERMLATVMRLGDSCPGRQANCAGPWLGGLVGSGNLIALNRWTTNDSGAVVDGGLYVLNGTKLTSAVHDTGAVEAASADGGHVAVLRISGGIALYSSGGKLLWAMNLLPDLEATALSGRKLAVLTTTGQLEIFDTTRRQPLKTFPTHGGGAAGNLDVQGNVAIYSAGSSVRAVNLSTGKDRVIGKLGGDIGLARIGSAGVVYSNSRLAGKGTLVFVPFARVAAAVS